MDLKCINKILTLFGYFKSQSHKYARTLSSEMNPKKHTNIVESVLKD